MTKVAARSAPTLEEKELLDLAAFAAGYQLKYNHRDGFSAYDTGFGWNPLQHDGDAIELAVKVDLWISLDSTGACVKAEGYNVTEPSNGNPAAALRRAIVNAAAYIGEQAS